jgi:ADP-ribose pyrophosphatase YjhB (NUDIX family)
LVKRDRAPFKGHWCLPTGFAEAGESIEDAALRELQEETGVKGRISRLLDVDSYKSRFYGDLLFLTFIVEQTGGKLAAGDDCAKAMFWPVSKLPPLAYWSILDSIENADENNSQKKVAKNSLTRRLLNVILKNKEKIIYQWMEEMTTSSTTAEYHNYESRKLYIICDKILSQITLWLSGLYDVNQIKSFYTKLGRERKKADFKISEVLSALSLIRKHIWTFALAQDALQKNLELYMTFELQRRMTIFFDLATFYLTRGYEEK